MQVIIPGGPQRYALRLVAYAPHGARLGLLPAHLGWEAALPLNDVSSLRLSYSASALGAARLASPCEIAVEYSVEGGAWAEPENGRFLRIKRSSDATDRAGALSFDCPGYAWMLRKLVVYPALGMVDGKRLFSAKSAGEILSTVISEGKGRGTLRDMGVDFDAASDSADHAWATTMTLGLEPGMDLLTLLINLAEQGVIDWCMQGRTLRVYNADTALAVNRAAGPGPVELRLGRDIDSAPDDATLEDAASAILVVGEDGLRVEVTNSSATMPWGRWESYQAQGGVTDEGTARLLGDNALQRAGGERVQLTRSITPYAARWLPLEHYAPGDYIQAPGDQGVLQALRVRQITLSCDSAGMVGGNLTLNDRFLERDIKLARQAAGILAGGVSSGGSGADPAPEDSDREPAAPTGLLVSPTAYLDEEGYAHGQITVSWDPVSADVNGTALSVDGYELVGISPPATGAVRVLATTSSAAVTYSPLEPKSRWQFGVRAVNGSTRGQITASAEIVIPDDQTPPPDPSAPVVDSRLGVVRVTWDGLTGSGTGMPRDFARVLVMMRDPLDSGDLGRAVEWLDRAGTAVVAGLPYNTDREFWLVALDRSGNPSGESAHVVAATRPLVDTDVIGQVIDGATAIIDGTIPASAKITAGTITGGLIQALAIQAGHLNANAVTADKIEAGAIQTGHLAAAVITADKISAGAITAGKLSADAIDGRIITGSVMRSAATGRRFILDSSTLDLRFYPGGSSNYSRIYSDDSLYSGETALYLTSGSSFSGISRAELQVASQSVRLRIRGASGSYDNGGNLDITNTYARYGYNDGSSSTQCYIHLDGTGYYYIRGRFRDTAAADPYDALHVGSYTIGGAAAPNWLHVPYGPTMATNMGPVCTVRDGGSGNSYGNNFTPKAWAVTYSSVSGFQVNLANSTSFALYWWSHRHAGSS
ncbi:fibronectin type III domain-containing protein [Streptosporangium sp. NPDC020072]|uniref:fibronectin type III domain-containing protein n=1 Tax=Streptosporangium sp. NPDC020072 TaxID=3154788 RepID=UPI003436B649